MRSGYWKRIQNKFARRFPLRRHYCFVHVRLDCTACCRRRLFQDAISAVEHKTPAAAAVTHGDEELQLIVAVAAAVVVALSVAAVLATRDRHRPRQQVRRPADLELKTHQQKPIVCQSNLKFHSCLYHTVTFE